MGCRKKRRKTNLNKEIKEIIDWTLIELDMYSPEAAQLVYRTGMAESGYRALRGSTKGNPAIGFWQVEPATIDDCWDNFIMFRQELLQKVLHLGFHIDDRELSVLGSLALQIAFCRIKYWRYPKKLPKLNDIGAQAKYWKDCYNSKLGRGTLKHFMEANEK